jgi:hypothetical protein
MMKSAKKMLAVVREDATLSVKCRLKLHKLQLHARMTMMMMTLWLMPVNKRRVMQLGCLARGSALVKRTAATVLFHPTLSPPTIMKEHLMNQLLQGMHVAQNERCDCRAGLHLGSSLVFRIGRSDKQKKEKETGIFIFE